MSAYQHSLYSDLLIEVRRQLADGKITQVQIGTHLGLAQASVSALLNGKSRLNVDQLLGLCELAGISLQNVLRSAEVKKTKYEPMTKEMEETLYKSDIHIVLYCAAVQEIDPKNIKIGHVGIRTLESALHDLVKVDLLVKKGNAYIQKSPNITYFPHSRRKNMEAHLKVIERSVKKHLDNLENKNFPKTRFNWAHIDRFTTAQIKELESACWRVFEKFENFQKQNSLINYVTEEPMDLWNLHVMIMPIMDS